MNYISTIEILKSILHDANCNKMNRSTIKGYIGELLVKQKLESENIGDIQHFGNQSGYDLKIIEKKIKIDVKLSLYKSEIKTHPDFKNWGWALQFERNKGKPPKCTHFVCVALNDFYEVEFYYVIQSNNLERFKRTEIKQFKNVIRGFITTKPSMENFIPNELKDYFNYCQSLVDKNIVLKISPAEKLSKYLNH